tara:strand:- start:5 stop:2173 length:2169 start_codon:yes stop_codon:yes gene_type:complete
MQKLQLYIDGQRADMFEEISVTITDSIKNVRDVAKVFTEYSQTFSLPASKTNNKIFKHYYNSSIENGYDARIRATANIDLNSIPYKKGYIKLEGVDLRNNNPHTYRITFFGNTVSLKDLLGDDLLSSLGSIPAGRVNLLEEFSKKTDGTDLLYDSADIETYLTTQVDRTVDGVVYSAPVQVPLITHSQRLYYESTQDIINTGNLHYNAASGNDKQHGVKFNELKYALKLSVLIKAIEEKYGLNFSSDFLKGGDSAFNDLYMWLHRKKAGVENLAGVNERQVDGFTDANTLYPFSTMNDNALSLPLYQPPVIGNVTTFYFESNTSSTSPYKISIRKDGIEIVNSGSITSGALFTTSVPVSFVNTTSQYTAYIESDSDITFQLLRFVVKQYLQPNFLVPGTFSYAYHASSSVGYANAFNFKLSQQIPKMKVIDFLTSIFKMFNLVAYVEGDVMVVKTLDDFYANPSSDSPYDITKYIDVNESQVNSALPFREVNFSYKGLKTFLAKRHDQLFNEEWGTEEYSGEDSAILSNSIYKIEIPFEHMKFERLLDIDNPNPPTDIQYGYCVDDNQQSYIGMPLVFYMDRKTLSTGGKISFIDAVGTVSGEDNVPTSHKEISSYYAPANSDLKYSQLEDRQSINFSPESDEWELVTTTETLFNNYYKKYISSVFDKSNRLTKVTAFLPLRILHKYTLADRFVIAGKSYKINSIETDFYTGKSEIELLSDI